MGTENYSKNNNYGDDDDNKLHFVLVHGASHGGWCWYKIRALLEAQGHRVTCLDLKCSGTDPSDFNAVFGFDDYNQPLTSFLSNLPPNQKVILVGHSIGGLSVTHAIHKFAEKVLLGVYVAGAMLKYGMYANPSSDHDDTTSKHKQKKSDVFEFIYGLGGDQPPTGIMVKPQLRSRVLYNKSSIEDYTLASMLLRPAPARALGNVRFEAGPSADSVQRVFIRTMQDQLMSQNSQDYMINQWPPYKVFDVQSDHSPFFSAPQELFQILVEAVKLIVC